MSLLKAKNKLRIVYMGTPDFAVAGLQTLISSNYEVVGVITAPDKPAGRGRKIQESAVKKYAVLQNLEVLQPTNLKNPDFVAKLIALNANLFIVVAFRMLPKVVWQLPEYGTFNLHASLLPEYRGAAPINWAVMNGEKETGVTTFFIDEKIDTGKMILQRSTPITEDETAGTLHDRLMLLGADTILETVKKIETGSFSSKRQEHKHHLKAAPKIFRETCAINWNAPMKHIFNHIRGLSPYPAAWSTLIQGTEEIVFKVYHATMLPEAHKYRPGKLVVKEKGIKVAVKEGFIELLEIQIAGKRRMKVKELLNGYSVSEDAYVR